MMHRCHLEVRMRSVKFLLSLLTGVLLLGLPSFAEETARVIPERTSIYSAPSAKAGVTGSLERGHAVVVDLTLSDSGGTWCLVREPGRKGPAGYVHCSYLMRQASPQIYPLARSTSPVSPPNSATDDSRTTAPGTLDLGGLEGWARQLGLTDDQQKSIAQSFATSGLSACRNDIERAFRRYGVTDGYSFVERTGKYARNRFTDSFAAVLEPKIQTCAARYKSFWQVIWKTLTPAQKEIASHTTLLLAYLVSQKEPETPVIGSVLQQMRPGQHTE